MIIKVLIKKPKSLDIILDLSGHKTHKVQVDNMADPYSVLTEAHRLVGLIEADPTFRDYASIGKLIVILPGLSVVSAAFIAVYHGKFGHFPMILWYLKTADGFEISDAGLDLASVRIDARKIRKL
jgi:hypothetical protein